MTPVFTAFISPGSGELILIMLVLILLFGAKDAPRILRSIQSALARLQRTAADFRYKIMYSDLDDPGLPDNSPVRSDEEPEEHSPPFDTPYDCCDEEKNPVEDPDQKKNE